jgi:hypothetical protein
VYDSRRLRIKRHAQQGNDLGLCGQQVLRRKETCRQEAQEAELALAFVSPTLP